MFVKIYIQNNTLKLMKSLEKKLINININYQDNKLQFLNIEVSLLQECVKFQIQILQQVMEYFLYVQAL